MKILLGVDTSPLASETVSYVCRASWPPGTSVIVLSVIGPNEPDAIRSPVLLASVAQDLTVLEDDQVQDHEEFAARAEHALREAGLAATSEIVRGDPGHILLDAARSHGVDLIVVGCHGHSAIRRLVMGSVASYVVNHAPCNVLVVPHTHRETEVTVRAGAHFPTTSGP
jgi:nucleotide-binding universal stress UspA family protein